MPTTDGPILVYVTSPAPQLIKLLSSVRAEFIAYGFNREGREGNILYKKPSFETFFDDLVRAQAIVANAGFSLVTEALHLGKPYLAMPVQKQFEQIFNAFWLGRTGYGAFWEELTKERVESFLFNIPHFREKLAAYPRTSNQRALHQARCADRLTAQTVGKLGNASASGLTVTRACVAPTNKCGRLRQSSCVDPQLLHPGD